jgi:hypothetical protein
MEPVPCLACSTFFTPRNKLQDFCSNPNCQLVRKNLWQKKKLATDPEYREEKQLAQKKWLQHNPDYWKNYRRKNQEKTTRNRSLQKIRNMRRKNQADSQPCKTIGIAKMDARKVNKDKIFGQYWLVPMIAKMDAIEIFITSIPGS